MGGTPQDRVHPQSMNISLLHEAKRVTDTSASSRLPSARVNVMQTGPDPLHGTESKRRTGRSDPLTVMHPAGRCGRAPERRRKA